MSLDYKLLLVEIRKLRREMTFQIDELRQPFDEPPSTAVFMAADNWGGLFETVPVLEERVYEPAKEQLSVDVPIVADNWARLFKGGDDSIEQLCAAQSVIADNWGGLLDLAAHIAEECELALSAIDANVDFEELAPTDQIRVEGAFTFPESDTALPQREELALDAAAAEESEPEEHPYPIHEELQDANIATLGAALSKHETETRTLAGPPRLHEFGAQWGLKRSVGPITRVSVEPPLHSRDDTCEAERPCAAGVYSPRLMALLADLSASRDGDEAVFVGTDRQRDQNSLTPFDPGPELALHTSTRVHRGAEVAVLSWKLDLNGVLSWLEYGVTTAAFLATLCGGTCSSARSDLPEAAVRRTKHLLHGKDFAVELGHEEAGLGMKLMGSVRCCATGNQFVIECKALLDAQVVFDEMQQRYITNLISASWMGDVLLDVSAATPDADQKKFDIRSAQIIVLLVLLLAIQMNVGCNDEHTGCNWEWSSKFPTAVSLSTSGFASVDLAVHEESIIHVQQSWPPLVVLPLWPTPCPSFGGRRLLQLLGTSREPGEIVDVVFCHLREQCLGHMVLQSFNDQIAFHSRLCSGLDLRDTSLSFHWDPGGGKLLHWLADKPQLRKGGISVYTLGLLTVAAMDVLRPERKVTTLVILKHARLEFGAIPSTYTSTIHSVSSRLLLDAFNICEAHQIFVKMFGSNPVVLELLLAVKKPAWKTLPFLILGDLVQFRPATWAPHWMSVDPGQLSDISTATKTSMKMSEHLARVVSCEYMMISVLVVVMSDLLGLHPIPWPSFRNSAVEYGDINATIKLLVDFELLEIRNSWGGFLLLSAIAHPEFHVLHSFGPCCIFCGLFHPSSLLHLLSPWTYNFFMLLLSGSATDASLLLVCLARWIARHMLT